MSINRVENANSSMYHTQAGKLPTEDSPKEEFVELIQSDQEEEKRGKVRDPFAGMSFDDVMSMADSGAGRKIPVVNQIVSARNPEDGEIYRAFFTDQKIICNRGDGRRAWEIEIPDARQAEKVEEFFEKYEPDRDLFKEYYSGDKMGMAVVESFWKDLFERS